MECLLDLAASSLLCQFNCFEKPPGFVERFLILFCGDTVGNDACPGLDVGSVVLNDDGSQRNAGVHVAGEVDITHRTRVRTAAIGFEAIDDFHGTDLGRS